MYIIRKEISFYTGEFAKATTWALIWGNFLTTRTWSTRCSNSATRLSKYRIWWIWLIIRRCTTNSRDRRRSTIICCYPSASIVYFGCIYVLKVNVYKDKKFQKIWDNSKLFACVCLIIPDNCRNWPVKASHQITKWATEKSDVTSKANWREEYTYATYKQGSC